MQKTKSTSQDDSNNTNSFADLVQAEGRVPSSGFDRQSALCLQIDSCGHQHCSLSTAQVKYRKPTASLKMTRRIQIVLRIYIGQQTESRALDSTDERE
eukprot:7443895-Pyramimonas_sp.AAC.1